MKAMA